MFLNILECHVHRFIKESVLHKPANVNQRNNKNINAKYKGQFLMF